MNHFFAYMARMKLIRRWGLMRSVCPENDAEHSLQVAQLAHGLAVLSERRFGRRVDPNQVMALALYHDAAEVLTGDMPTPIKHHDNSLQTAYGRMEALASQRLLTMLPEELQGDYAPLLMPDTTTYEWALVKAADRISAYVKCLEEQQAGNREFDAAKSSISESLRRIPLPEVQAFITEYLPSFELSLDEMSDPEEMLK